MDHLSAPAGSPTERRTGLTYSSLGVEVEEPLFLDEAEDKGAAGGNPEPPSPFDLFADENELAPPAETILGIASPVVRPAVPPTAAPRSVPQPARVERPVPTRDLFTQQSSPNRRVGLVALLVLIAATAVFATAQACQLNRAPRAASTEQPGR